MFNQKSEGSLFKSKMLTGLLGCIGVFIVLELLCAYMIHREILSLDIAPFLSYAVIFIASMVGAFLSTGNQNALRVSMLIGLVFLLLLLAFGVIIYKGSIELIKIPVCALVIFAAVFSGVLIKTSVGARHGRNRH